MFIFIETISLLSLSSSRHLDRSVNVLHVIFLLLQCFASDFFACEFNGQMDLQTIHVNCSCNKLREMSQVELGLGKQFEVQSRVIHARKQGSGLGGRFFGA